MEITALDILEAFSETGLKPIWGSFGDGKNYGCACTAYAKHNLPVIRGRTELTKGQFSVDNAGLKVRLGADNFMALVSGYEFAKWRERGERYEGDKDNPYYQAGYEAGRFLLAAEKDTELALAAAKLQDDGVRTDKVLSTV